MPSASDRSNSRLPLVLREYADAVDKDRGGRTGLTIAMRDAAKALDAYAKFDDVIAALMDARRSDYHALREALGA